MAIVVEGLADEADPAVRPGKEDAGGIAGGETEGAGQGVAVQVVHTESMLAGQETSLAKFFDLDRRLDDRLRAEAKCQ